MQCFLWSEWAMRKAIKPNDKKNLTEEQLQKIVKWKCFTSVGVSVFYSALSLLMLSTTHIAAQREMWQSDSCSVMDGSVLVPLVCRVLWNRPCRAPWTLLCSWPGWSPPYRCDPPQTADSQTPGSSGMTEFLKVTGRNVTACSFLHFGNLCIRFTLHFIITQGCIWQH